MVLFGNVWWKVFNRVWESMWKSRWKDVEESTGFCGLWITPAGKFRLVLPFPASLDQLVHPDFVFPVGDAQ